MMGKGAFALDHKKMETGIDVGEMFCILWGNFKSILVIALCCVFFAAAFLWAREGRPRYESEACLLIKPTQHVLLGQELVGGNNGLISIYTGRPQLSAGELQSCIELLQSRNILQPVVEALGEEGNMTAEPLGKSQLLKVKFSASDAEKARQGNELLLRGFFRYLSEMGQSETKYIANKREPQPEDMPLQVTAVVASRIEAQIVDPPSLPMGPVTPKWKMTIAVGALFGILIGSGLVLIRALMSPKVTE